MTRNIGAKLEVRHPRVHRACDREGPGEIPSTRVFLALAGLAVTLRRRGNLPFNSFDANTAWLEIVMTATDLVAWAKLIGFADHPHLARCEIDTFRYRVLHVAARITRGGRRTRLRIDATWRWATAIATAWIRIRDAFT